jgi:hypothetical protein
MGVCSISWIARISGVLGGLVGVAGSLGAVVALEFGACFGLRLGFASRLGG